MAVENAALREESTLSRAAAVDKGRMPRRVTQCIHLRR
jgi:hypothetical protein